MMVLVIGGSGSGKSFYAEDMALSLAKAGMKKYYLATMQIYDEEGRRKVKKHRKLRDGKGFTTIEQPTEIAGAVEKMEEGEKTVLLECISNLAANEMFAEEEPKTEVQTAENIINGIKLIKEKASNLVVVSNNVFEDGEAYDETTMEYIQAMGRINMELAKLADKVVEVVAGIAVRIK
ncbi:MAG: bifunctional adenosylcobinamide kinase/adenosylcobinamide-phosphate guanylyltransferase [Butyrivibrio sp.]|nr:bifunctional adenosylcobinamide kinase/adenosylcobinamide-phosphate guanylyltransferase [Butyrivibrio sp.]